MKFLVSIAIFCLLVTISSACTRTTASGTKAPANFCAGDLIFEDNFDSLDETKWKHEVNLGGGGNWEFQWYVNDRFNSYTVGGILHLKPSLTSSIEGEHFLTSGRVIIPPSECTNAEWYGCDRQGTPDLIINPIRSARITTKDSFSFKYGILEISAKAPKGDWLWPALWLMPRRSVYGTWPRSGEIDLMELRGNKNLFSGNVNVGAEQVGSTMHFGPRWDMNGWGTTHNTRNLAAGFDSDFHKYKLVWTPTNIEFFIDDVSLLNVVPGDGFWQKGGWQNSGLENPWRNGTPIAPFDQEFFIIMNLAVGGVNYFSDSFINRNDPKPWSNTSPTAARDFWRGRSNWEPTWNMENSDDSHLKVDYVRVWAL